MVWTDGLHLAFASKKRRQISVAVVAPDDKLVHMTGVLTFARRRFGVEGVDIFKMRRVRVESFSIDYQVAVVTNANGFAAKGDKSFDVEFIFREPGNAPGFEDDDFAAFGRTEIVGNALDEQVIAGHDLQFDDVLAFVKNPSARVATVVGQAGALEDAIRREPDGVHGVADLKPLAKVEDQYAQRFFVKDAKAAGVAGLDVDV